MNFCFQCGNKLSLGNETFCPNCGQKLVPEEGKKTNIDHIQGNVIGAGVQGNKNVIGENILVDKHVDEYVASKFENPSVSSGVPFSWWPYYKYNKRRLEE